MNVQFSKASIGEEEIQAVTDVMRSGWLAAGKETEAFEKEFSDYISPDGEQYYCIFTNSGTAALKMAYKYWSEHTSVADFLCMPRNTFCATYAAAEEMGCLWMYHEDNEGDALNRVNIHYGGVKDETPCFLEDSAHRIEPKDPLIGRIRIYSFYVTKNMTTGAGGMFVTKDKEIYERARLYWRDGLTTSTWDRLRGSVGYEVEVLAGGYDGNDLAAAMGRAQLRKLPELTRKRNEVRDRFNSAFGQQWTGNHLYPYFVRSEDEVKSLITFLKEQGVACSYHYPGTGWLGVSLPIFAEMTDEQIDYVIEKTKEWRDANL